ncbi:MAG TPA: short-chain dehydrogenase/reductase, partial [Conexibacter sp.]|nr:short-chain dehydrogenase/reductase [Conexibacter sp.]
GLITTDFGSAAVASMTDTSSDAANGGADPYAQFNATVGAVTKGAYEGPLRHFGGGPDRVAKAIAKAISRRRAPTRVVVTPSARTTIPLRRVLPDRAWDAMMRQQFPQPK